MKEISRENNEIERLLRRAKLPEPSSELRERVTSAAKKAWDQAAPDVPWQVPLRRLAISAAAAVLMVSLANYYGDHALAAGQSYGLAAATEEAPELNDWLQIRYGLYVRHLSSKPSASSPASLFKYKEKVRQILDESEPPDPPDVVAPVEHRSRLLPTRLSVYS